jgi:poly-gamma-glutamate synthesis protein (capsule biosynthesis protein)
MMRRVAVLALLALAVAACSQSKSPTPGQAGAPGTVASSSSAAPTSVRVVATGDMIAHDAILQEGKRADGSYAFDGMLTNMKPYFSRADVRFCNEATPAAGTSFPIKGYPVFNAPVEWSRAIEGVGCNLINLGTNHTNDYGQPVIDATRAAWDGRPGVLAATGANRDQAEHDAIAYFTVNGVKFAFLTYLTYNNTHDGTAFGVNTYSTAGAKAQIAEARQQADIIIVSMRWGTEDVPDVNSTQRQDAQELADAGADIVLGHGPHSLQPVERLTGASGRETIVWYSLGNFLNAQLPIEELVGGFAVMDIDVATKKVTSLGFLPTFSHYTWTPAQQAAHDLLSRHDFAMYALDKAAAVLGDVQDGSTVEDQSNRVNVTLNHDTKVAILTSDQYLAR